MTDGSVESIVGNNIELTDSGELYANLMYMGRPESIDYKGIKTSIVKVRYSLDDQLAIICNRESGEEGDEETYQKMQKWRDFASDTARKILLQLQTHQE